MHFYTFDDWKSNSYYSKDNKEISKGTSRVIELTQEYVTRNPLLSIRSCFCQPTFVSTYSGTPSIIPKMPTIDLDVGCLYKLKDGTTGSIQYLEDHTGNRGQSPFIELDPSEEYYDDYTDLYKEILTIDLFRHWYSQVNYDKILIFQSIYSGAISFQESNCSLEIFPCNQYSWRYNITTGEIEHNSEYDYKSYEYKINTNMYSDTSLMIASALITFDTFSSDGVTKKYMTIDSICDFAYGQSDLASRYGWNSMLWKGFIPPSSAEYLESSIMHYTKR